MTVRIDELHFLIELALDRTAEGRRMLAAHISDLCSDKREVLSEQEADLITEILQKLIAEFEWPMRRALSERLAVSRNVPHNLIVTLANDEIEVARPVLMESELLRDEDLIEIIRNRGHQHQLAVARRRQIGEVISDALAREGDEDVIKALLENKNSQISEATMAYLVEEARRVDSFHEPLVNRHDLSEKLAKKLYWWVAAALRSKILENFDIQPSELDDAMESSVKALREDDASKDSEKDGDSASRKLAKAIAAQERITGEYLLKVLRRGEISLFESLFGEMSGLRSPQLERILYETGGERLAITARALQMPKQSFATIFMLTRGEGQPLRPRDLSRATKVFDSVKLEDAQELLGIWQRDNDYQDAIERLWAGTHQAGEAS